VGERVIEHDVGGAQELLAAHRNQPGIAGAGTHQPDLADGHRALA
jgi:hypothetical protein